MPILTTEPAAPHRPAEADRARDRLNRIARPAPKPDRQRDDPIRDADAPRRQRDATGERRHGTGKRERFQMGWVGWVAVDVSAIAVILGAILVWPPARACREQEAKIGFYAGDTLGKCIRRGVAARIDDADQRLKMAVRGSGK